MKKIISFALLSIAIGITVISSNVNSESRVLAQAENINFTINKNLRSKHPAYYYQQAQKLFAQGNKDQAAFVFYLGQLRYRFLLQTNQSEKGALILFNTLQETVGRPINKYLATKPDNWIRIIDQVLVWEGQNPNSFTDESKFRNQYIQTTQGLHKLRDYIEQNKQKIIKQVNQDK
ncbi:MAG: hypothetical protein AAF208_13970 [Cyanobacteria bacterium P01_A01_bin.45]